MDETSVSESLLKFSKIVTTETFCSISKVIFAVDNEVLIFCSYATYWFLIWFSKQSLDIDIFRLGENISLRMIYIFKFLFKLILCKQIIQVIWYICTYVWILTFQRNQELFLSQIWRNHVGVRAWFSLRTLILQHQWNTGGVTLRITPGFY